MDRTPRPGWLYARQAAALIGCGTSSLRIYARSGLIRTLPLGPGERSPRKAYLAQDVAAVASARRSARAARVGRLLDELARVVPPSVDLEALWRAAGQPEGPEARSPGHRARAVRLMLLESLEARDRGDRPASPEEGYARAVTLPDAALRRRLARVAKGRRR